MQLLTINSRSFGVVERERLPIGEGTSWCLAEQVRTQMRRTSKQNGGLERVFFFFVRERKVARRAKQAPGTTWIVSNHCYPFVKWWRGENGGCEFLGVYVHDLLFVVGWRGKAVARRCCSWRNSIDSAPTFPFGRFELLFVGEGEQWKSEGESECIVCLCNLRFGNVLVCI